MLNLNERLAEFILKVFAIAKREEQEVGATTDSQFKFACEELGELAREINRPERTDEGITAEAVDLTLSALATVYASGGSPEDLITLGEGKLKKWGESITRKKYLLDLHGVARGAAKVGLVAALQDLLDYTNTTGLTPNQAGWTEVTNARAALAEARQFGVS